MAFESEQTDPTQDTTGAGSDATGADDLSGVLGAQDATFVTSEKKQVNTGTLVMAGFIIAAAAGTYLMYKRSADANTVAPTPEATAAQTTITQFLSNDKANATKMRDLLVNTEKAVEQFRASPGKKQIPVEELQTNPFSLARDNDGDGTADEPKLDELEAAKREAEAKAALLKSAQALNLQFIVSGKKKSCLINGARYVEGQTVGDGFTVESIATNSVIVRKDDTRFELKMKKSK